jgi:hypothetical protein
MNGTAIEFLEFPERQTGEQIAQNVWETIQKYNLNGKIVGIVVDNCSANDVALGIIAKKLKLNANTFPTPEELHYRCFGHIMNIGCKGKEKVNLKFLYLMVPYLMFMSLSNLVSCP